MFLVTNHVISGATVTIFAVSVTGGQLPASRPATFCRDGRMQRVGCFGSSHYAALVKDEGRISHAGRPPFRAAERAREGGDFRGLKLH